MSRRKIALAGIGKIARDEHVPALAASADFELVAAVTRHTPPDGIPGFTTITEMKQAIPDVTAISICTPPRGRLPVVAEAFEHGLDVMVEKPPAATLSEAERFGKLATAAGKVLFLTWHSRAAAGIAPASAWLEGKTVAAVEVTWKEDVRVWHPGQSWIWEPGIGVFDPGINALSVISAILRGPLLVDDAALVFPANKDAPIAASLKITGADGMPVDVEFDFDQRGPQTWNVDVHTDSGHLQLSAGGSELVIDGERVEVSDEREYPGLYRRFAELIREGASDADLTPFQLVADSFMLARRSIGEPFDDF